MSPLQIFSAVFGLFAIAMLIGCLVIWTVAIKRLADGHPVVPLVSRKPAQWGFDGVIVALGLVVLIANAAAFAAQRFEFINLPQDREQTPLSLTDMSTLLSIEGASRMVACGLLIVWMVVLYRVRPLDLGFTFAWSHLRTGLLGCVALLPPIYLLQAVLTVWWVEYEHPVLDLLQESGNPMYLLPMAFIAVIVAPLTEEFMFRVVLQGWLESIAANRSVATIHSQLEAAPSHDAEPTESMQANDVPYWPILISSIFFALAHLGHGPAPVTLFFLALGLGYLYRQTHSIWPSLLVHLSLNAITMVVAAVSMFAGEDLPL